MSIVINRIYRLSTIIIILASFTPVSLVSKSAECAMADSQMILPGGKTYLREINEEKVRSALENKIVAERLRSFGLSKEEVIAKMDKMSDGQIHQLAALSDRIPAGGQLYFLSVIALVLLIVLLVVLLAVAV